MERFIADLVKNYESGKVDRREFCKTVALAATIYAAGDTARAEAPRGLKMIGINHISYTCPDYAKVRDWYVSVLGMESMPGKDNGQRANLMFGPEPGKGGSFVVARTARPPANPRPPAQSVIDHVCYTIPNWDDGRVNAALRATGRSFTSRSGNMNVLDPFNYPVHEGSALKVALVNHISYSCPNFRQAADWYSKVFNLEQVGLKDTEVTLPFGKMGEQPYNITAKDVPPTFIIARSIDRPQNPRTAGRPKPDAVIDHIGYTVADFNRERVKAELIAMGVKNVRDGGLYSLHMDDPFGYDVQISGLENNALTDG
jgi:catechol 2,3-dioxygenase-like lactoylglutathione lyase family enzyme